MVVVFFVCLFVVVVVSLFCFETRFLCIALAILEIYLEEIF